MSDQNNKELSRNNRHIDHSHHHKWTSLDVPLAVWFSLLHLLSVFAPFAFTWSAFWVSFGLTWLTGLFGITLSYHRNLSHRSFDLPKWLEYVFAYCGILAGQRDPIYWVSLHRYHHQYVDSEKDPHSPIEGFWFSHIGWLIYKEYTIQKHPRGHGNVEDLKKQPFYSFIRRTYSAHIFALATLLYAVGGFPYLVWGMGVRSVVTYHTVFLVNSVCHTWGTQAWKTSDLSKNNWWVALIIYGEGWHNNHHAFEYSARHGLEWWQYDPTWYVIRFLQAVGLATNVKLPNMAQMRKISFSLA